MGINYFLQAAFIFLNMTEYRMKSEIKANYMNTPHRFFRSDKRACTPVQRFNYVIPCILITVRKACARYTQFGITDQSLSVLKSLSLAFKRIPSINGCLVVSNSTWIYMYQ